MILLVTNDVFIQNNTQYKMITSEESLSIMNNWNVIQFDTETTGRDPHLCKLLCAQFGNKNANIQIIVDCETIDIKLYKELLESKLLIGHNLKFDLQFLYNYEITPTKVWDTMIVEQLLHLGFNNKFFHYSLKDVAMRYLGIDIDKSVRGEIIWRGLDDTVILYAAGDVMYLEDIQEKEELECEKKECTVGAKVENYFVPVIAYLEWCGIMLDIPKWKKKMEDNEKKRDAALKDLNEWVVNNPALKKYTYIDPQGDLFSGFQTTPTCIINWESSLQVVPFMQELGFNTTVEDKKTGEKKDSVVEKVIVKQKGIADDFLNLYFAFKEASKECSTYGSNYIDSINPKTNRIHTTFWQLGAASGRMSCGSTKPNTDLAHYKCIPEGHCIYPQLQNLPADEITRSSFIAGPGNMMLSCDYSALESRLGADIYNEPEMLKEFLEGSGDMHSLCAKMVFKDELKDIDVKDIKKKRPDLRKKVKPIEFSQQFGGGAKAVANSLGCSLKEAQVFVDAYRDGFKGIADFKKIGSTFVRNHGYVVMCQTTGHKIYWEDWEKWKEIEELPEQIRNMELTKDELREHNMAGAKWDRMALNSPTQGTGAIIIKIAATLLFMWILKHNYFSKIRLCDLVHDEMVVEFPEELKDTFPQVIENLMKTAAAQVCFKLPIPAEAEVGDHWIH